MMTLSAKAWNRLSADALSRFPEEACGILLGHGDLVLEAFPCRNAHPTDPRRYYELAPSDQFECARYSRSSGLEWVAYYHSHPNGSSDFSPDDRRSALPGSRHLVVAVSQGHLLPPRAWRVPPKP